MNFIKYQKLSRKTMGHSNRRAGGDGLWIELHKRSEAESLQGSRKQTAREYCLQPEKLRNPLR